MKIIPQATFYSKISRYIDIKTLLITLILLLVGLLCVYSATINTAPEKFNKQMMAAGIGIAAMFVVSRININYIKRYSFIFYIITIILLFGLFPFGSVGDYGTTGWYRFLGISFQPSEFAKIALILGIASYLSAKGNNIGNVLDLGKLSIIFLCPFILILKQPDVGTAITLLVLYLGLLYWSGADLYFGFFMVAIAAMFIASLTSFVATLIVGGVVAIILLFFRKNIFVYILTMLILAGVGYFTDDIYNSLSSHQQARISVFLNPEGDVKHIGYNLAQAKLAVGSGGITGKGYMQGSITKYRYVPMHHTDFIYSVPAEEWGFVGSVVIMLGLLYLCYRGINIAYQSKDIFCSLVVFGASIIILFHIVYNIGMVLGMFPVIGIPLPFFSCGGTFLISNLICVGLIMNVNKNNFKV